MTFTFTLTFRFTFTFISIEFAFVFDKQLTESPNRKSESEIIWKAWVWKLVSRPDRIGWPSDQLPSFQVYPRQWPRWLDDRMSGWPVDRMTAWPNTDHHHTLKKTHRSLQRWENILLVTDTSQKFATLLSIFHFRWRFFFCWWGVFSVLRDTRTKIDSSFECFPLPNISVILCLMVTTAASSSCSSSNYLFPSSLCLSQDTIL